MAVHAGDEVLMDIDGNNLLVAGFVQLGLFNEADTLESSSILIYSHIKTGFIYTNGSAGCHLI